MAKFFMYNFKTWWLYGVYGLSHYTEKKRFWTKMMNRIGEDTLSWLVFGDMNEIINYLKRFGG